MAEVEQSALTALILAGGQGRRLGGRDKGLVELAGRPIIEWVLQGIGPQVGRVLINANRNQARYAAYGHPVINDELADYQGPLAGFAAGMARAETPWLLTLPCDGPLVPPELAARMRAALAGQDAELAVAHDGERLQPVYALLPVSLARSLQAFLATGDRKIDRWYAQHRMATVDFSDCRDCFGNVNSPEDQQRLAARLEKA